MNERHELEMRADITPDKMKRVVAQLRKTERELFSNEIHIFDLGAEAQITLIKTATTCQAEIKKPSEQKYLDHDKKALQYKLDILGIVAKLP